MSDFSIYKSLKTSELTSNASFSTTGTGPSTSTTGAANAISQSCTREGHGFKVANLSATTSTTTMAEAKEVLYTSALTFAAVMPISGAAVANATDYSTINLIKQLAGNQAAVVIATCNTSNVALTQWKALAFTIPNVANAQLAPGDVLTANVVLTGNGCANNIVCTLTFGIEDV